jgi:hypothetical protein
MANNDFFIMTFDKIDNTQRILIQAAMKEHAVSWWHRQENVWIVEGGGSIGEWLKRLKPFTALPESTFFVFRLPAVGSRAWAGSSKPGDLDWLRETYSGRKSSEVRQLPVSSKSLASKNGTTTP